MKFKVGDKIKISGNVRCMSIGGCIAEVRNVLGHILFTEICSNGNGPHALDNRDLEKCSLASPKEQKKRDFRFT
jgi:hypothetical protein